MSRYTMSLAKATTLLQECGVARTRWGKHVNPPYTTAQIMEALELVTEAGLFEPRISADEVTKLRRQLSAANARAARLSKGSQTAASQIEDSAPPDDVAEVE